MARDVIHPVTLFLACLIGTACQRKVAQKEAEPFRIIATEAGFEAPKGVAAGLRHIVFENRGSEIHEAMLVKLPTGMSPDDYVAAVKKRSLFPEGALDYSGPGLTSPGGTSEMWSKLDPGHYIIICWNDSHATTVPVHPFTVREVDATDDRPPKEDLILKLVDYRFELSGPFRKGVQVVRIETVGPSMHEIDIYHLHDGQTGADLHRWRKADGKGPAPADALGGALDNHDLHRVVWLRKNLSPGRYVLHCEMPVTTAPADSNLTHADVGMMQEFEIKD